MRVTSFYFITYENIHIRTYQRITVGNGLYKMSFLLEIGYINIDNVDLILKN